MKKRWYILCALLFIPVILIAFTFFKSGNKSPVTLTLWHNYGGQLKDIMDELIDEFNGTIGVKEGVIINVTSISGSSTLHDKLVMAANEDPGAPALPDITTSYPKTALILAKKGLLADLEEQFTVDELSGYIPRFLEEGRLVDGTLYVFPTAKSTEVLFVNLTLFNRFAKDTYITLDSLRTFEGIMEAASLYYRWTDLHTPDIPNDGKTFFVADSLFNYSLIGCRQLGSDLIKETSMNLSVSVAKRVWDSYFSSAIAGHSAIFDGYSSDLAKTGDIICSTGSTAGVAFYSPTVTYSDNTSEPVELTILPYPVFEGGEKVAIQRGAGMCVTKSTKEREKLAGIFIKWFTSPENNIRFVSTTGYLPVTEEAFGDIMLKKIDSISDENIKELMQVAREMQMQYEFYVSPLFDGVDELQDSYEKGFRALAQETRDEFLNNQPESLTEDAIQNLSTERYLEFIRMFDVE